MWAVYCRVSSTDQSTAAQERELQRWLDGHDVGEDDVRWFVDRGESGKDLDRPAFQQLQSAVFNGEVSGILVWKLDRISRDLRDGINTLCGWCEAGIRVVSATQELDLAGPPGKLIAGVLFAVAEMERSHLRERQRAGIDRARAAGRYRGSRPGHRKAKPARAAELKARGLTHSEIASSLGVSRRSVVRYLKEFVASDSCGASCDRGE